MQDKKKKKNTSWEDVSAWYDQSVGETGHYYHEKIILPNLLKWIPVPQGSPLSVLDLACGQGILSRHLPSTTEYLGIDLSPSLLEAAREKNERKNHQFLISDITKPLPLVKTNFSLCAIVLALQNLEHPLQALKNASKHLAPQGTLLLVLNHPCFRIPKHSHWGIDEDQSIQYRRMDRYKSSLKIPIQLNPSLGRKSIQTFSFHHSLSQWTAWLKQAGFAIEEMKEWCSDKVSTGKHAPREDLSRKEFPLFLAIKAFKFKFVNL